MGDQRAPAVQHHLRKNERVASMIGYLERLERETARVRGDGALAGSPLGADLLDLLARQKALMAQVAGKFIQGRLADMARLIDGLDADKEIIGFETTKGEKEMLETDFDVRSQLDTERLRRPARPRTARKSFPSSANWARRSSTIAKRPPSAWRRSARRPWTRCAKPPRRMPMRRCACVPAGSSRSS